MIADIDFPTTLRMKEKRKILMVLSDGQQATGDGGHSKLCTDLRKKVELIKAYLVENAGISADRISTNLIIEGGDPDTIDFK